MTGFEYELNKQRHNHALSEAQARRQANEAKPNTGTLRTAIGRQLVKLGERLQADTQPDLATHVVTAYEAR